MDVLQVLWTNAMDYYNNQRLNTTLAIFSLLYLATFYIDRLICLDKCLRDDAQPRDIRNATILLLVIFIWCVFCFLVLRFAAGLSYLLCLAVFFIGWGLLTLLIGRRLLQKVEDPEKKRVHFYGLLFPKE